MQRRKEREREGKAPLPAPYLLWAPIARHLPHYSLHFTACCPLCAAFLFVHTASEIAAQRAATRRKHFVWRCGREATDSDTCKEKQAIQAQQTGRGAPGGFTD